jgi:hypothetical protein
MLTSPASMPTLPLEALQRAALHCLFSCASFGKSGAAPHVLTPQGWFAAVPRVRPRQQGA